MGWVVGAGLGECTTTAQKEGGGKNPLLHVVSNDQKPGHLKGRRLSDAEKGVRFSGLDNVSP